MPKYYVSTGDIKQVVIDAPNPIEAVVQCIRNHISIFGEVNLGKIATVNEQGASEEAKMGGDIVFVENILDRLGPGFGKWEDPEHA